MKKMLYLVALILAMMLLLTACSSKCALCGEKISGKKYTTYHPYAATKQEIDVCEDCYNEINSNFDFAD